MSFDSFNKLAGVYDAKFSTKENQLKSSIDVAKSYYWTGISTSSDKWISDMASELNKDIYFTDGKFWLRILHFYCLVDVENTKTTTGGILVIKLKQSEGLEYQSKVSL